MRPATNTLLCSSVQFSKRLNVGMDSITSPFSSETAARSSVVPQREFFSHSFQKLMNWYEEFTGLKDVRTAQNKVLLAQERFVSAQNSRRDVSKQLTIVRDRLKEIYSELDQTTRGEDRYVVLITQEHKILKEEKKLVDQFNQFETEERDNFSCLSSAVKESHEKERIQAERTKYWSIIGSIIGTMIGVAGSSINNEFKMRELRKLVKESAQLNLASRQSITEGSGLSDVKEITEQLVNRPKAILSQIESQNSDLQTNLLEFKRVLNQKIHQSSSEVPKNVESLFESQRRENRVLTAICVSATILLFLTSKLGS